MRIKNIARREFVSVRNAAVRDNRLSFRARGLLAYMLSHVDEWEFSVDKMAKQGTEGKDAIRTAVKELEACGYLIRESVVTGGLKRVSYLVSDEPLESGFPDGGSPDDREADGGRPDGGYQADVVEDHPKDDYEVEDASTEDQNYLPSPASRPPARKQRARDPIWDALMVACGISLEDKIPPKVASGYGGLVKQLKAIGATPELIEAKANAFRWMYRRNHTTLTPYALLNQWPTLTIQNATTQAERVRAGIEDEPLGAVAEAKRRAAQNRHVAESEVVRG